MIYVNNYVLDLYHSIRYVPKAKPKPKTHLQQIAKMLREQCERENTYEKQDCFERAAKMVEGL